MIVPVVNNRIMADGRLYGFLLFAGKMPAVRKERSVTVAQPGITPSMTVRTGKTRSITVAALIRGTCLDVRVTIWYGAVLQE